MNALLHRLRDDGRVRLQDAVEQLVHVFLQLIDFRHERFAARIASGERVVPHIFKARERNADRFLGRLQLLQYRAELALQRFAPDRLAVAGAPALEAQVIGVAIPAPSLRPARRERRSAIAAAHGPAQREICVEVFAGGRVAVALETILNLQERFVADKPLMLALAHGDTPERGLHHPGVERLRQDVVNLLRPDLAVSVSRKLRNGFEMALHFRLRRELPASEALHRILDDRGERLIADDDLAAIFALDEFVSDGNEERVIAALDARLHFLDGLPLVLHALQFALRGDDRLDELAFRRVLEFEIEAFGFCAVLGEARAQADVKLRIPREALEIVEDDDVVRFLVRAQVFQKRDHAAPVHEIARAAFHIAEHGIDDIAVRGCVRAAAMFLAAAPVSVGVLADAGDARIEDRSFFFLLTCPCHLHLSFCTGAAALLNAPD